MTDHKYVVAIFGGGVAGSEAAFQLSQKGITSVLFEQNPLPYGKIEEGLPKWHIKLRDSEEEKIDQKLNQPEVHYVPGKRLGEDLPLQAVLGLGFNAVLLAVGAWHDRPLPIEGIDSFVGKGLYYQNQFVTSFNHQHEPDYKGQRCEIADGAVVIGGGLASLDVIKILMLETTLQALREKNIETDLFTLERMGIPPVLKENGLSFQDLGLRGCTLFYRRRKGDMPLAPMPPNASPDRQEKIFILRERILQNYVDKYLFRVEWGYEPVDKITENGRLTGIVFKGSSARKPGTAPELTVRAPLFISSIGSVPTPIKGLPYKDYRMHIRDEESGLLEGYDNVFALGNAITGRGNIKESLNHGRQVSRRILMNFMENYREFIEQREADLQEKVRRISDTIQQGHPLESGRYHELLEQVKKWQREAGYDGNYSQWIQKHKPLRLEEMLDKVT
ncbi:MAG: FAD-dependent oxidoreductase [Calditrichia bacterium]